MTRRMDRKGENEEDRKLRPHGNFQKSAPMGDCPQGWSLSLAAGRRWTIRGIKALKDDDDNERRR